MRALQRPVGASFAFVALAGFLWATQLTAAETTFSHGGYVKFDAMATVFHNGAVAPSSPVRDFHIPGLIPVGLADDHFYFDSHAKQSRLNFQTTTKFDNGREIKGYVEMDFLLSASGNERVSNSYNPRLRHYYFSTGPWLFGQTWMTFMVIVLPDDIDFIGVSEGTTFGRQPQIRFTHGGWRVSLENSETTVTSERTVSRIVTGASEVPDLVIRRDVSGDWGAIGLAAIARRLSYTNDELSADDSAVGYGVSVGSKINSSGKDDLRVQATAGSGLGRYVGLNFANAAAVDTLGNLSTIDDYLGFVAYRHYWNERWRSTVHASFFHAENPSGLDGVAVNRNAQSYSANLVYSPTPGWSVGIEYHHASRELEDGRDGRRDRVQFSTRYDFGYTAAN